MIDLQLITVCFMCNLFHLPEIDSASRKMSNHKRK